MKDLFRDTVYKSNPNALESQYAKKNSKAMIRNTETQEVQVKRQKNEFLKLLLVQLKNQDPTNPMDTNEMSAQIFHINEVEQLLEINKKLGQMAHSIEGSMITDGLNFLGKGVQYKGHAIEIADGKANLEFEVDGDYEKLLLKVVSPSGGNHTFDIPGDKNAYGKQRYILDVNNLADGVYQYYIEGIEPQAHGSKDDQTKARKSHSLTTYSMGAINSFEYKDGKYMFEVNDESISQNDIIKTFNKATPAVERAA